MKRGLAIIALCALFNGCVAVTAAIFEACAAGRLLLLEPTADTLTLPDIQRRTEQTLREKAEARHWDYQPIPVSSDRYHMMAMNEIVKILCPSR